MTTLGYVIAGSEATGGAGIQADLKTFQELGVYGVGTITCIVSFDPANNWGHKFVPVAPETIADQITAATGCHDLDVVKIGMLGTPATIEQVAKGLATQEWRHVVLDPVLICKGQEPGAALDTDTALKEKILPLATVVTPNLFEAAALSGMSAIESVEDLVEAARIIHENSGATVIAKGGVELPGELATDVVYGPEGAEILTAEKIGQERVSGAGCTLAAAITAELAKGATPLEAAKTAKALVTKAIEQRLESHAPFTSVVALNTRGL